MSSSAPGPSETSSAGRPRRLLTQNREMRAIGVHNWSLPAWAGRLPDGRTYNTCPSAGICRHVCYARSVGKKSLLSRRSDRAEATNSVSFVVRRPFSGMSARSRRQHAEERTSLRCRLFCGEGLLVPPAGLARLLDLGRVTARII